MLNTQSQHIPDEPKREWRSARRRGKTGGSRRGGGGKSRDRASIGEGVYLKEKLKDVLGRQATTDVAHQQQMILYRQALRQLYDENAALRNIISSAEFRKRNEGQVSSPSEAPTVTEAEVRMLSNHINISRRTRNRLLCEVENLQSVVDRVTAEMREAEGAKSVTGNAFDAVAMEAALISGPSSLAIRVQKLERQLNTVLAKQRMVATVLEGYKDQQQQLQLVQWEFDNQVAAVEQQHYDRHKDHLHLVTLFQNATYDYDRMAAQRSAMSVHMKQQRVLKEKLLVDRRAEVQRALLEADRFAARLADLQLRLDEESQKLEEAEAAHHELQRRVEGPANRSAASRSSVSAIRVPEQQQQPQSPSVAAEEEEGYTAYHLAAQSLLKSTKVAHMEDVIDVFRQDLEQYAQLQQQVQLKRQRFSDLQDTVRQLRAKVQKDRVCVATAPDTHSSVTLLRELRVFLEEAKTQHAVLVEEEEGRRILLQDVAAQGNRLVQLISRFRPELAIGHLDELDAHLPLHFTALTQKVLALADAAAAVEQNPFDYTGGGSSANTATITIPEHNVRLPGELQSTDATKAAKKTRIATMASSPTALETLQTQGGGGPAGVGAQRRSVSTASSMASSDGQLVHSELALSIISSAMDDDDDDLMSAGSAGSSQLMGKAYGGAAAAATTNKGGSGSGVGNANGGTANNNINKGSNRRTASVGSDDLLHRTELKAVSMAVQRREKKRALLEEKRRQSLAKIQ